MHFFHTIIIFLPAVASHSLSSNRPRPLTNQTLVLISDTMHSSLIAILATASAVNAAVVYNVSTPIYYASSSTYSAPATSTYYATPQCPAPGSYDSQGRYSCNPAHSYPAGQTCVLIDGCYYLHYAPSSTYSASAPPSSTYSASVPPKSTYSASSPPKSTSYAVTTPPKSSTYSASTPPKSTSTAVAQCPAPGTTDSQGRYLCNPARSYPAGQTCVLSNGCYYLQYPKSNTTTAAPQPSSTKVVYTGAASTVTAFGGLAALVGLAMFAL